MTIPADLVAKADQTAGRWHRSRSWVIAEAVRQLPDEPTRSVTPRPQRRQVIAFDTLEDFYQWKKARRAGA